MIFSWRLRYVPIACIAMGFFAPSHISLTPLFGLVVTTFFGHILWPILGHLAWAETLILREITCREYCSHAAAPCIRTGCKKTEPQYQRDDY